jgi:hypothetical protein
MFLSEPKPLSTPPFTWREGVDPGGMVMLTAGLKARLLGTYRPVFEG